jgi:putative transcriptional regulator
MHHGVVETDWSQVVTPPPAAGHLLVATPALADAPFHRSVVYLLEHNAEGTLGVVINRPSSTPVEAALPAWRDLATSPAVLFEGGPVQPDGALCLGATTTGVESVDLDGDSGAVVGEVNALRVFAGYAGWSAGQLEGELEQDAWWVVPGSPADLFTADPEHLWSRVLRRQPPPLAFASTFPEDPSRN